MSPTQPTQMPPGGWDRPVATPPPLAPPAGWWSRVGAALVDAVVILVPAFGPFRSLRIGRRHIHHFVPGILLAFSAGAAAILTDNEEIEPRLALVFGTGMGLTLDESALLLELDDVYWTREGVLSVQITLAAMALISASVLGARLLRRGEEVVLEGTPA